MEVLEVLLVVLEVVLVVLVVVLMSKCPFKRLLSARQMSVFKKTLLVWGSCFPICAPCSSEFSILDLRFGFYKKKLYLERDSEVCRP